MKRISSILLLICINVSCDGNLNDYYPDDVTMPSSKNQNSVLNGKKITPHDW